mmetsp:Transcript_110721/g.220142  ORF Transcript_110721/g.220142 Transcript_110721/m.220142 type:complete len:202 (-) Transcript_110721:93-698(-)
MCGILQLTMWRKTHPQVVLLGGPDPNTQQNHRSHGGHRFAQNLLQASKNVRQQEGNPGHAHCYPNNRPCGHSLECHMCAKSHQRLKRTVHAPETLPVACPNNSQFGFAHEGRNCAQPQPRCPQNVHPLVSGQLDPDCPNPSKSLHVNLAASCKHERFQLPGSDRQSKLEATTQAGLITASLPFLKKRKAASRTVHGMTKHA